MHDAAHILPLLGAIQRRLDADLSLRALATIARRSPFDLHRAFRRVTGETTRQYTERLRLDRAAAELLTSDRTILDIALDGGFASHEVFTRAFRRRFGTSPREYRARSEAPAEHVAAVRDTSPCIGLYRMSTTPRRTPMSVNVTVTRRQLDPRPALIIRRKVKATDLAATLGEILPKIFAYAQRQGIPLTGPPFTRYVQHGVGMMTIEGGLPTAAAAPVEGEIEAIELPGGPAAIAIHKGPYDGLGDTHAAVEAWVGAQGLEAAGAPWESYVTDPADKPDPREWETEVVWPLRA